jgi:hypothetical protein
MATAAATPMADALLFGKRWLEVLQAQAVAARAAGARQELVRTVKALNSLHALLSAALARYAAPAGGAGGADDDDAAGARLMEGVRKWLKTAAAREALPEDALAAAGDGAAVIAAVRAARREALEAEQSEVAACAPRLPGDGAARAAALGAVVAHLRALEESPRFQGALAAAVAAATGDGDSGSDDAAAAGGDAGPGYSAQNYAYGSTPFPSWLDVCSAPAIAPALAAAMAAPGGAAHVVWGSSTGWLAFYGALAFGWADNRGVEILPCLVADADATAQHFAVPGVAFSVADLRDSPLSGTGFLELADQCWDGAVVAAARAKIAAELPAGAVVLSYAATCRELPCLRPLAVVPARVSWNAEQAMSAYVCER